MKRTRTLEIMVLGLVVCLAEVSSAAPMGTAWTYQGRLIDSNEPANGLYDLLFFLYDDPCTASYLTFNALEDVEIVDGYFTVELDFQNNFNGDARWMKTSVRQGHETGGYRDLSPRQELTPTPYSIRSDKAGIADSVVGGHVSGSGNANYISKFTGSDTLGNSVIYESGEEIGIGTTNPLEKLHVKYPNHVKVEVQSDLASAFFKADCSNTGGSGLEMFESGTLMAGMYWSALNDFLCLSQESAGKLVIRGNNVGIGTFTPQCGFQVVGDEVRIGDFGNIDYADSDGDLYVERNLEVDGFLYAPNINTGHGYNELYAMDQDVRKIDNPTFNIVHLSSYGTALGGFHVGSGSDPGTDNLIVDGLVGVGTTSPGTKLDVEGGFRVKGENWPTSGYGMEIAYRSSTNKGFIQVFDRNASAWGTLCLGDGDVLVGPTNQTAGYKLDVRGTIGCTSLTETSDERLKTNINELSNVLDKVKNIRGVSFEWNQSAESFGASAGQKQIGVVAQEVEAVFPELVSTPADGYKRVEYSKLTAVLVEAVKELKSENDLLKERLASLERTVQKLVDTKDVKL